MTNPTPNHDTYFRASLTKIEVARSFIEAYLPHSLLKIAKFNTLKIEPTSFIDEQHKNQVADILYSLMLGDSLGYIYVNIEHQNRADKLMPLRMLKYLCGVFDHHLKQHKNSKQLPVVVPMLIYNGKVSPYPYSTDIFDLFTAPELAKKFQFKPIQLVDLTTIPDDELLRHRYAAVMEMLGKHIYARDLIPMVKRLIKQGLLVEIRSIDSGEYLRLTVNYILSKGETQDKTRIIELLTDALPEDRGDIMTIADALRQEGYEIGIHDANVETVKRLLACGISDEEIVTKISGLPLEEVRKLIH